MCGIVSRHTPSVRVLRLFRWATEEFVRRAIHSGVVPAAVGVAEWETLKHYAKFGLAVGPASFEAASKRTDDFTWYPGLSAIWGMLKISVEATDFTNLKERMNELCDCNGKQCHIVPAHPISMEIRSSFF